jgi:putative flavoprotein involved in K+ transport
VPERVETVVVGGGQAGLAVSSLLTQRGREHVVLERGRIGETWRTRCWDGFRLNTPNWTLDLPGRPYSGPEPDAFGTAADLLDYLEDYAGAFKAPVRLGVEATRLDATNGTLRVVTGEGTFEAENVVVASGAFQVPHAPAFAPSRELHLHANDYRRPEDLPEGAVLVVGSGQSGCQIGEELVRAGRRVYLSVGRCPWAPRRYRGLDIIRWLIDIGLMDQTVEELPSPDAVLACNPTLTGNDDGHECNPLTLEAEGAILAGRLERLENGRAQFANDVNENLAKGLEFVANLISRCDAYVGRPGPASPGSNQATVHPRAKRDVVRKLDLAREGVGTVLFATGYRPDYSWIDLPVIGGDGRPRQRRGVTDVPGLYFVGLHWLHKRKSALLLGVREDAEHVVDHLAGER